MLKPMKTTLATIGLMAALSAAAQAQDAKAGDAKAGEKKAAMCIGCHGIPGYQASFPEVYKVPMISGQGEKYLATALNEYKAGTRKHPTMRSIADSLVDQDIADLAAYYAANAGQPPAVPDKAAAPSGLAAEALKKGNCISCHGENFNKPLDPSYPKIAGQHADYLYVALKAYQTEGNPNVGRANAIMAGMVKPLTHAELKALAQYISGLPGELKTVSQSRFR